MNDAPRCQSCSMTIENGTYCEYCTDKGGSLLSFAETCERFVQFAMQREPGLERDAARTRTLEFMSTMPAWREHPDLAKARGAD